MKNKSIQKRVQMTINRSNEYILSLIYELIKLPNETEWLEFKHNKENPQIIG